MKSPKQIAIDELLRVAKNNRRIGDAPVMTLIEVVAALDAAGLLALPGSGISVRGGDTSPVMRERLADARATASLLGSEGFTGIRLETQVRSLIAAWSEGRQVSAAAKEALHAIGAVYAEDLEGDEAEALADQMSRISDIVGAALAGAPLPPLDPDAPIPYTLSEPPPNAAPEAAGGEPRPKCGEPLLANGECLNFPSCPSAALPF